MAKKKQRLTSKQKKQLQKLTADKTLGDLRAEAEALGDRFVEVAGQAGLLERAVIKGATEVMAFLLEAGVHPDARPGLADGQSAVADDKRYVFDNPGPLVCLTTKTRIKKAERAGWVTRLIEAGASPMTLHPDLRIINPAHRHKAHSPLDFAVVNKSYDLVELLLPHCDEETRASATVSLLRATSERLRMGNYWHTVDRAPPKSAVKKLLGMGLPCSGVSRWGLPVEHAIALFASLELFELFAPRCEGLAAARIGDEPVVLRDIGTRHEGGGWGASLESNATVTLGPGTSPLGAVRELIPRIKESIETHRKADRGERWIAPLERQIERLQAIGEQLAALGDPGTGAELVVPESLRGLVDAFSEWTDEEEVADYLRSQDLSTLTPYLLALRLAERFARPEVRECLGTHPEHPIAILLDHQRRALRPRPIERSNWIEMFGNTQHNPEETLLVDPEEFHADGRELIETGRLFAAENGTVWGAGGVNGEGDVFAVSADSTVVYCPVDELLRQFLSS